MELSVDQQDAIKTIIGFLLDPEQKELALLGGGGVGKTFLVKYLLDTAKSNKFAANFPHISSFTGINTLLSSTTNKASAVLAAATDAETVTIHKALNLRVFNNYDTGETSIQKTKKTGIIRNTLIFIDEASMLDTKMLNIIREQTHNCKLIYILDNYQLAPVGALIIPVYDQVDPKVRLTTIHRQEANNTIIPFAQKFREALDTNIFPKIESHLPNVELVEPERFKFLVDGYFSGTENNPDYRILAWTNKRVHQYNAHIRMLKGHPNAFGIGEWVYTNQPVVLDKYETVYHTDQLIKITDMHETEKDDIPGWNIRLHDYMSVFQAKDQNDVTRRIKYFQKKKDWLNYFNYKENFADLRPAYASTIDKSQGSTFDTVFVDVEDVSKCTHNSQIARLMYVAISRASNKVIMRGNLPTRLYP